METTEPKTLDLSFQDYTQRQLHEISLEGIQASVNQISPSGHFSFRNSNWVPEPYEGFAILSMTQDNPGNVHLNERLKELQIEIESIFNHPGTFYSLPTVSYHQTIANTLSAERFQKHIKVPGLEKDYPEIIGNAFRKIHSFNENEPIRMSMVGLSIFRTAIGILGIFKKEDDYFRILRFRQKFYSNHPLQELGIRMTRPFIGHITLGYFEKVPDPGEAQLLSNKIQELNHELFKVPPVFFISQAGLRKYLNLSQFDRKDEFPYHSF